MKTTPGWSPRSGNDGIAVKMGREEPGPISGRYDASTILGANQLADVACRGLLNNTSQVIQ